MYEVFNSKFPKMRPLSREVYGKMIFLAGVENEALREHVHKAGVRDILVSYYYLRNRRLDTIRAQLERFDNVILDSGGFTFIQQKKKGNAVSSQEIENYTREYIEFCDQMADCFNFVFEMDMTWDVSPEYRHAHIKELLDRGVHVVPIVHSSIMGDLEKHGFYDHPLVAFAGDLTGGMAGEKMTVIRKFQERGILIHGLAATDEASINRVPFFSTDSSSWVAGGKYGLTYIWNGSKITVYDKEKKQEIRGANYDRFKEAGLDPDKILEDDYESVNVMNAWAWKQYIDHVRYNIIQSYWLTDEEKAAGKDFLIREIKADAVPDAQERYEKEVRSNRADLIRAQDIKNAIPGNVSAYIDPRMAVPLECNNCSQFQNCPAYKKDNACYYHSTVNVSSLEDVIGVMGALLSAQHGRVAHGMLTERFMGGNLDPNLSKEIKTQLAVAATIGNLYKIKNIGTGGEPPLGVPQPMPSGTDEPKQTTIDAMFSDITGPVLETTPIKDIEPSTEQIISVFPNPREQVANRTNEQAKAKLEQEKASPNEKKTYSTGFSENPQDWPSDIFS